MVVLGASLRTRYGERNRDREERDVELIGPLVVVWVAGSIGLLALLLGVAAWQERRGSSDRDRGPLDATDASFWDIVRHEWPEDPGGARRRRFGYPAFQR
jgi:hypothetical protein